MAVHNEGLYLEKCLDSILAQTYPNWELIAVNDHSTDQTPGILRKYAEKDSRIRVYHSQRHKLIPALKEGYEHCRGVLINRMDADDYMPEYKLKVLVEEWKKYGKGVIIAGGTSHFVEKGEVGEGFRRYDRWLNDVARRNAHYVEIYQECVIPSHCWIIHKDDFDAVGAFDPEVYPEDYDLCFRFYKQGLKIVGIDKILHYWRDHSVRISRTWDCYRDNRYFELKLKYFYEIDRNLDRPLVLWGAGRNGKDLARLILKYEPDADTGSWRYESTTPKRVERRVGIDRLQSNSQERMNPPDSDPAESVRRIPFGSENQNTFQWVCDNEKKIGKEIYGIEMKHCSRIPDIPDPQVLIVVNAPDERIRIRNQLITWNKKPVEDFWFFT
jgi:glycosyltransferase involved in cell wall biosynthesis